MRTHSITGASAARYGSPSDAPALMGTSTPSTRIRSVSPMPSTSPERRGRRGGPSAARSLRSSSAGQSNSANLMLDEPALSTRMAAGVGEGIGEGIGVGMGIDGIRLQCDISTGIVMDRSSVRVAPPITSSCQRAWP
ncbi:protein of unknown function [Paraburkholderia kururiensis]